MSKADFSKEESVIREAETYLAQHNGDLSEGFSALLGEYSRLLRQTRRLVGMGDRMQRSLSKLNRKLAINELKYRSTFEHVAEGIFRTDFNGRLVEVNPAMAAMFGFTDSECMIQSVENLSELFCDEPDAALYDEMLSRDGDIRRLEVEMRGLDDTCFWCEVSASILHSDESRNSCEGVVGVIADVTERKLAMEKMCRLARTDSLTRLWNRGYFMELAKRELARSQRRKEPLSLLMVDVDLFKKINDTYGHDAGDEALRVLSDLLRQCVREVDVVARLGGEEFIVLLPDTSRRGACHVAQRMMDAVRNHSVTCCGQAFGMTVSIGVATGGDGDESLDDLLKSADVALYAAKENGRDRCEVDFKRCAAA